MIAAISPSRDEREEGANDHWPTNERVRRKADESRSEADAEANKRHGRMERERNQRIKTAAERSRRREVSR